VSVVPVQRTESSADVISAIEQTTAGLIILVIGQVTLLYHSEKPTSAVNSKRAIWLSPTERDDLIADLIAQRDAGQAPGRGH
jgi:hypothetical protein